MKSFWFIGLLVLVGLASCSNDLILNTSADPTPVIWCVLNPNSDVQYVRLGRSYLPDPNHPDLPPITDSTVWNLPVKVYVEEWKNNLPVQTFWFIPETAAPKDSGFFPSNSLRLYKCDFQPDQLSTYHLYVHFPDDDRIITGQTTLPGNPIVYDPLEIPGRKINLQPDIQFTSRWAPGYGRGIFQGLFLITYQETINGQSSTYPVPIPLDPLLGLGSDILMSDILSGKHFLEMMVKQIPVREGAERTVINVQFRLFKGGEELALMVSPDLQETTISNNLNQYTNLSNGIGIFSSLQQVTVNNLQLSNTTLNELAHGTLTHNLGFKDIHGGEPDLKNDE